MRWDHKDTYKLKMDHSLYLDANASEPVRDVALSAMVEALRITGNPSSIHGMGRRCYHLIEDARESMVALFGGNVQNCIFTSGGTEADILAVYGQRQERPLWVGATEHPAISQIDLPKTIMPVDHHGVIDLSYLEDALRQAKVPPLLCLMLANNETGVIHPITKVAELCHAHGALLHVDAVQAAGRIPVHLETLGADSLALSAHKMGGPKGVGALLLFSMGRSARRLDPVFAGGGQEQGRRGGTQALPVIMGMVAAAQEACCEPERRRFIRSMRDLIEQEAKSLGAIVCGEGAERLDNTSCLAVKGLPSQRQLIALDMAGVCVSTGSACSSGKVARSAVLMAMGMEAVADCAIRVSLPWNITEEAVRRFIPLYQQMIRK